MRYLIIVLIFLLNSCSKNVSDKVPNWYLQPQANDVSYLYGVAYAGSLEQAEKLALKTLSEKLAVTIAAQYELSQQQNIVNDNELYETRAERRITTEITKIKFENYETLRTEKIANKIYAEVRVNRVALIEQFLVDLAEITKKLNQEFTALKNKSLAQNFLVLAKLAPAVIEAQDKLVMLKTLGAGQDLRAAHQQIIEKIKQARFENKQQLKFQIVAKPAEQRFADIFANDLNQQDYTVVKNLAGNDQGQPVLKINSQTTHQKIYGVNQVKITLTIKLLEHYGNQLASNQLVLSASSAIDENSAVSNALEKLRKQLVEQNLLNILGVKS